MEKLSLITSDLRLLISFAGLGLTAAVSNAFAVSTEKVEMGKCRISSKYTASVDRKKPIRIDKEIFWDNREMTGNRSITPKPVRNCNSRIRISSIVNVKVDGN